MLRAKHPKIGHATVYRALKLFADCGIAREIRLGDGLTRYEKASAGERHDHLVCTVCGAITEFDNRAFGQLQEEIASSHGFRIEIYKIELRGVCRHCLTAAPATQRRAASWHGRQPLLPQGAPVAKPPLFTGSDDR